jgi:hypothetical protein
VDPNPNLVSIPFLVAELETLAPSWAISNALAHLIFVLAWEIFVVLD